MSMPMDETAPHYAGFWIRWSAAVIDGVLLSTLATVGSFALLGLIFWGVRFGLLKEGPPADGVLMQAMGLLSYALLSFLYFTWTQWRFGTTVGKVVFRIYVQDARTGEKMTLSQSAGRALSAWLSWVFLVGYLMAGWSRRKQALHDLLAGTVSIVRPARKIVLPRTALASLAFLIWAGMCLNTDLARAEEDLPMPAESPAWAKQSGRGPFPQLALDLATGAQGSAGAEISLSALFTPFANPWTFLGPRAAYWTSGRDGGGSRRDVSFGAEWSLWLLNAAGPGLAVDYVLAEGGRGGRFKFEPWLALRIKRISRGGALSGRVGVAYDSGDKWGFRLGLMFQPWGVFNVASAVED